MPCIYGARLYNHVNSGVDVGTLTLDRTVMNYEISSTVGAACIRVPNFNPKIYLIDQHEVSKFFAVRKRNESASKHEVVLTLQGCFRNKNR